MLRTLLVMLCLTSLTQAAEPKPAIVLQTRNFAKLFDDLKHNIQVLQGEEGIKSLRAWYDDTLGDKGLKGLDQLRPWAGYLLASKQLEDSAFILCIPITNESDFLDLIDRLDFTAEEIKGVAGLYGIDHAGLSIYLRFYEEYAILGFNATESMMEAKNLLSPKSLVNRDDLSSVALTVHPDQLTKAWREEVLTAMAEYYLEISLDELLGDMMAMMFLESWSELNDAKKGLKSVRYTINYHREKAEYVFDWIANAEKQSEFARTIANTRPQSCRFGAIKGNALTAHLNYLQPAKTVKQHLRTLFTEYSEFLEYYYDSPLVSAVNKELNERLGSTIEKKGIDMAIAMDGPDHRGHYEATFAMTIQDPSKLEILFTKLASGNSNLLDKDEAEALKNAISLNASKMDDVNIHTLKTRDFLSKECIKILGKEALLAVAFTKDAVYITVGATAVERMKTALTAKPTPAGKLDVTANPKRMAPLLEVLEFSKWLENTDKPVSLMNLSRSQEGESLRVRFSLSLEVLSAFITRE